MIPSHISETGGLRAETPAGQNTRPTPSGRSLYLRADDFGATPGTNEAIIDGVDCGNIRNVGILACGPYLDHSLDALSERADRVAVGLHAAINSEWPELRWGSVAPGGSVRSLLAADGAFLSTPSESERHIEPTEVARELEAQLRRLRDRGLNPLYLDCHMGFSWIPGVLPTIEALCARENLIFIDASNLPKLRMGPEREWWKLSPGALFRAIPASATDGSVWVFHPAYVDEAAATFGAEVAARRDSEAKLLINPNFRKAAKESGFDLARFDPEKPTAGATRKHPDTP